MKNTLYNLFLPLFIILTGFMAKTGMIRFLDFEDMEEPTGDNMGGFTIKAYIAETKDIDVHPTIPDRLSAVSLAASVTLGNDLTMVVDKKFIEVYITPRTLLTLMESQGEIDGKSFRPNGEFFYPSTRAKARGFAAKMKNAKIILIVIDPNTGERLWIGTDLLPVFCSPRVEFGTAAPDRRGVFTAFESDSPSPGYDYDGVIPLSSGDVPAIS